MGLVDTDTCFLFEWTEHRQLLQASDLIIMSTLTASYAEWRWQNNNDNLLIYISQVEEQLLQNYLFPSKTFLN